MRTTYPFSVYSGGSLLFRLLGQFSNLGFLYLLGNPICNNPSAKAALKKAYPDVFTKSSDVSSMLTAASAIQNLNQSQKSTLDTLSSTYRYDYWNLCEAMIENHQSNASAKGGEGYMDKEDIHRALSLETLRFKRKELNDRIRMRLRMVLNVDQIKDVPGLRPSVSTVKEWSWQ